MVTGSAPLSPSRRTDSAGDGELVELRGIEHIPPEDRWGTPSKLFGMWAGAVWNVEYVIYGTLAVAIFGLSFAQAVPVILVGNLFYVLTGLASLQGPQAGTTALTISRAAYGPRGNKAPSVFNWLTQVGFETEGIGFIVLVVVAMLAKGGVHAGDAAKALIIIVAVAVQALLPLLGHATILRVLKLLAGPFVVLFIVMAVITATKANLHAEHHGAGWGSLFVTLALVISAGGLGWTENANDYSRYLPEHTDQKRTVLAVALGGAIPSAVLEILGAAVATAVPAASAGNLTSITGVATVFPSWFVWPYFAFAIVQLFAINSIDLYSSGVTLQSLGVKLKRYHCVLIDAVVSGALAAWWIYSNRFSTLLSDFILFIIVWLAPWFAIFMVDWLLRGRRYDSTALLDERGGLYFRNNGFHWPALVAQAVGMFAAMMWLNAYSPYVSWLSNRFDGSDFSIFMGLIFGGGTYWLLARTEVAQEKVAAEAASSLS